MHSISIATRRFSLKKRVGNFCPINSPPIPLLAGNILISKKQGPNDENLQVTGPHHFGAGGGEVAGGAKNLSSSLSRITVRTRSRSRLTPIFVIGVPLSTSPCAKEGEMEFLDPYSATP